ncbi:MFS general substrate transporter [Trematosphaeria pertusa]|uniref:MFS general substrate transporter n=1 Tax=Trematosphaeria pertusa TaxID=390896 RepID=A0A6A6HVR8_9PLEO|nr:MFS general substrate transporter [Trematosphaeria pertusa]KAF2241832.1 MFS general substrate transporter [Trematosphaeria pertusa]
MAYLFAHSSVGSLLRYIRKGNLSFSRRRGKTISASSSSDDVVEVEVQLPGLEEKISISRRDLVDWDGPDDPSNPINWPLAQKVLVTAVLCAWTFAVYVGSSIYSSSQADVERIFGVGHVEGALGIALYVLGYGLGSLLFSPLSEIPAIGRNPPYAISGFLFVILCIPTALVNNFAGLMVLRFLLGFMCSPCLATAGASLADIWRPTQFPFAVAMWAMVATLGPACGPTISTYAVQAMGWRFSSWELLIISAPIYIIMVCFLPETSGPTILYYEAKRLREETGNEHLLSAAEQKQKDMNLSSLLFDAFIKPWEMNLKDPALLFTTFYLGLAYGVFYSFFESLPLVYPVYYGFSGNSTGLIFLAVLPAGLIAFIGQVLYLKYRVLPLLTSGKFGELENHLIPGLLASPLIPIGLFIYAWTSRPSTHWIAPTIGLSTIIVGIYSIAQSIFLYIPNIYPRYAASIFAANSLARSLFAFAAILFSTPMFEGIGIDGGVSLLGGLMVLCVVGMGLLYKFGKVLRARSSFAVA